ncbi:heparin lyase I family protein [Botryobacter ruber]|uniref:heparin lyase I family protein n=1 Tax=Botryobacter ruber TaxID=2171629 RepID=UPI0013E2D79E|nr:heparin lyase I family protein [Botryobacter ruber]
MSPNAAITAQSTNAATTANLLYEETFEGSSYFPLSGSTLNKTHNVENCETDWTLSSVSSPVFQGSKAARFEIRQGQPLVGSGEKIRSEVTIIKGTEDSRFTKDIWYSFAVYFPSVGFEYDDERDCLNQWYEDGSDETTIRAEKDKVFLEVTPKEGSSSLMKYDLFGSNSGSSSSALSTFNNIPKNQWNEFTFHFIHSEGSDGLIEVFRNGVKIHHITGRNMHLEYPKWKLGLYKSSFLDGSSKHQSRVVYFDNIRVGKTAATLVDMVSGEATGSNTGSTSETGTGTTTDTNTGSTTETETGTTTETETGSTTETETGSTTETETGSTTETETETTTDSNTGSETETTVDSPTDTDAGSETKIKGPKGKGQTKGKAYGRTNKAA